MGRTRAALILAGILVLGALVSARAQDKAVGLKGFGVEEELSGQSVLVAALDQLAATPVRLPLFVRLHVRFDELRAAAELGRWDQLDERLALYARHHVDVLVTIEETPTDPAESESWRSAIRAVAEHVRGRVAGYEIGTSRTARVPDVRVYAFFLKLAAVQIRAADEHARIAPIAVSPDGAEWLSSLYEQATDVYLDLVVLDARDRAGPNDLGAFGAVMSALAAGDPTAETLVANVALPRFGGDAPREWLDLTLRHVGTPFSIMTVRADADTLVRTLTATNHIADILSGDVVALEEQAVSLRIEVAGRDVTAEVSHTLLQNLSTLAMYLVIRPEDADPLDITLVDPRGRRPVLRDALNDTVTPVSDFSWDDTTNRSRLTVLPSTDVALIDFDFGVAEGFVTRDRVVGSSLPSVSEIVFREQLSRAEQDALYSTYIASARMEQHFRASPTDTFDVVTTNRFYVLDGRADWEELSFSLNGTQWGPDRPAFPLLQAEKVLSLPLDVRLTTDYRYQLDGVEEVDARLCFVVRFEPIDSAQSLYRGRMWIDTETFQRVKVSTVQTQLAAPVVSNEETQWYGTVVTNDGAALALVRRVSTKQIFLIAGRNLLMEKETVFSGFEVDPPDFDDRRRSAHLSDRIMYRDTDVGVRYLTKQGDQRVVSDRLTTSAKALAMGTTVDPSFDFPLPILGLNYLDFDFLGPNSQLALLFGGVLALGNVQFPKVGRTPFDASIDVFAIAVPGNDVVFDESGERRDERVMTIPFTTGLNLGYQFTPFQKLILSYSFAYNVFFSHEDTADDFVVPNSTATHGVGIGYEYSRHGYTFGLTAGGFRRNSWSAWGRGEFDSAARDYRRYSVTISKAFYPDPFQSVHASGAWYGGRDLDRFSMYQFGLFDAVRMHGVPSAGVRFRELALGRFSYSFDLLGQFRIDLFLDQAAGRDVETPDEWRHLTGTGVAVNLRAPWQTILRIDVGKSFLPRRYAGAGSVVFQVLLLKPL